MRLPMTLLKLWRVKIAFFRDLRLRPEPLRLKRHVAPAGVGSQRSPGLGSTASSTSRPTRCRETMDEDEEEEKPGPQFASPSAALRAGAEAKAWRLRIASNLAGR